MKMKPFDKKLDSQKDKDDMPFMIKFKDKHSVISKEGLLKLLENSAKNYQFKHQKPKPSSNQQISLKSQDRNLEKKKIESPRKGSEISISKSVQLPQINPKQSKMIKSISTSVHLRKQLSSSPISKVQTDSIPRAIKKIPSSHLQMKQKKLSSNYHFQLDQFALDHLDFLDKFQQRIRKRQQTPKQQ